MWRISGSRGLSRVVNDREDLGLLKDRKRNKPEAARLTGEPESGEQHAGCAGGWQTPWRGRQPLLLI